MANTGASHEITYFHYRDDAGRDVIVTSLDDVPPQYRARMEMLDENELSLRQHSLDAKAGDLLKGAKQGVAAVPRSFLGVDGPSFAIGFVVALVLGAFLWSGRGGGRPLRLVVKVAVVVVGLALAGSLYFGFVMKSVGLGDGGMTATPADAINEARKAVDKANAAGAAQEKALEKLDR